MRYFDHHVGSINTKPRLCTLLMKQAQARYI